MKAAFLGHGRQGNLLLDALQELEGLALLGAAGMPNDSHFQDRLPSSTRVYQDYRSLIVEQPIDVLFVAGRIPSLMDYLQLAASKSVLVWRTAAPSQSLEQLLRVVDAFEQADCPFEIARSWLYHPAYVALAETRKTIGEIFLGRGALWSAEQSVNASIGPPFDLRGLLNAAYDLIDALVCHLGIPQVVFANACDSARLNTTGSADTADTAVIALRYAHGPSATISISQAVSRTGNLLRLDGRNGTVALNDRLAVVSNQSGQILARHRVEPVNPYVHQIQDLIANPDDAARRNRTACRSHVVTTAVVEAAALSARTGEAESPERILEIQHSGRYPIAASLPT